MELLLMNCLHVIVKFSFCFHSFIAQMIFKTAMVKDRRSVMSDDGKTIVVELFSIDMERYVGARIRNLVCKNGPLILTEVTGNLSSTIDEMSGY
jgi:hypothetical protein